MRVAPLVAVAGFAQAPTNAPNSLADIFGPVTTGNLGVELPREALFARESLEMSSCTEEGAYHWFCGLLLLLCQGRIARWRLQTALGTGEPLAEACCWIGAAGERANEP